MAIISDLATYDYDLDAGIYRLCAQTKDYHGKTFKDMDADELENAFINTIFYLKRLPLAPDRIDLYSDSITCDWCFGEDVILKTEDDMAVLIHNFIEFINQISVGKFFVQTGMFCDSPCPADDKLNAYRKVFGIRNSFVPVWIKLNDIERLKVCTEVYDLRR